MREENAPMKSASLKSAFKAGIVRNISKVRENESEYKYVTFLDGKGKATNVYLGQKSADQVSVDDDLTPAQLANAEIVLATNEAGEERLKLSLTGESAYTNLGSIFGEVEGDFEKEIHTALRKVMTARGEVTPEEDLDETDAAEEAEIQAEIAENKRIRAERKAKGLESAKK